MKKSDRGGHQARIRTLKRVRLLLCVIALLLCGCVGVSAVSLCARGAQPAEEPAQIPVQTETAGQDIPETSSTPEPTQAPGESAPEPTQSPGESAPEPTQAPGESTPEPTQAPGESTPEPTQAPSESAPEPTLAPGESTPQEGQTLVGEHGAAVSSLSEAEQGFEQERNDTTPPGMESAPPEGENAAPEVETAAPETQAPADLEKTVVPSDNHIPAAAPTEETAPEKPASWALPLLIVSSVLLVLDLLGIAACTAAIGKLRRQGQRASGKGGTMDTITHTVSNGRRRSAPAITVGQLHNIGARPYQEDSSGVANLDDGVFAVVADGMGGLSGGDKVSQKIVYTMLEYSSTLRPGQMDGTLEQMLEGVNDAVNQMLGPAGLKKSGSTLMAVLVRGRRFHWITVGDSHIYLYHEGSLVQLNQEHNRGQELLRQAIAGQLTFDEVRADPKKSGLTSYIGMGRLKYVEKSLRSIPLAPGDRVLLMTDGVFNALPEETICSILKQNPDVSQAAKRMEQSVIARACPHQDNFTAVILGF